MFGAIIDDIAEGTREHNNDKNKNFTLFPWGSHFTDDTVMSLAVAKWLIEDLEHKKGTLVKCMQEFGRRILRGRTHFFIKESY